MSMKEYAQKTLTIIRKTPIIGGWFENKPIVSTIRFAGVIADGSIKKQGISYNKFSKHIDKAFDKPNLKAVALIINSPGGAPAQTSLIADHIRRLADDKDVPVYAFVEDVAASGGYWLACAADEIYAQPSSIVGSIGVISASFGFEDFIKKHEIHRRLHTSGNNKSFLDPFVPEKKADIDRLKKIQSDIHENFKDWVRDRRGSKLSADEKTVFDGDFWTAEHAKEFGIIDDMGDCNTVLKDKYGDDIKFKDVSPEKKLLPSFLPFGSKTNFADDILEMIETRSDWSRYGL